LLVTGYDCDFAQSGQKLERTMRARVCPQTSLTIRRVRGIRLLQLRRDRYIHLAAEHAAEHGTLTPPAD